MERAPEHPAPEWSRAAWPLLVVTSTLYFFSANEADNDLWFHLRIGQRVLSEGIPRADDLSYTAAGAPWYDHEWLTQAIFAVLFSLAGDRALLAFKLAVGIATACLVWRCLVRHCESAWARAAVMVLVLSVLSRGFAIRPQIVTYLLTALLLHQLDCGPVRLAGARLLALAGVFVLWANAHGGFVLGVVVLGAFTAGPLLRRVLPRAEPPGSSASLAVRGAALAVALAAVCVNPYGPRLLSYIAAELLRVPHPLTEWQPVSLLDPEHAVFWTLLFLFAATLPLARSLRREPWRLLLCAAVAVMALRHQRHTPLLALCAATPLGEQLEAAARWLERHFGMPLSHAAINAIAASVAVLAASQLTLMVSRLARDGAHVVYDAREYPVAALDFMRREGMHGNLALPLDWGAYALWHAPGGTRVSLDGRFATVYPPEVVAANFDFFAGRDARLLDMGTTLILTPARTLHPRWLPGWHIRYRDEVAELFTREEHPAVTGTAGTARLVFP